MRDLKGGAPRTQFFTKTWALQLQHQELSATESQSATSDLKSTIKSLENEKKAMEKQILTLYSELKEVNGHGKRRRHKPVKELGERQKRRLKRARDSICKASLRWLKEDGYTPVSIQVL